MNNSPTPTVAYGLFIEAFQFDDGSLAANLKVADGKPLAGPNAEQIFPLNRIFAAAILTDVASRLLAMEMESPSGFIATTERFGQALTLITQKSEVELPPGVNPDPQADLDRVRQIAADALNPPIEEPSDPPTNHEPRTTDHAPSEAGPPLTVIDGGAG